MRPGYKQVHVWHSAAFGKLLPTLPAREQERLMGILQDLTHDLRGATIGVDSESIAYGIHGMVDEHIERLLEHDPNAHRVTCKRGCNACCFLHVHADRHEGELLASYAIEEGLELDVERMRRQAGRDDDTWRELAREDQRCVFNDPATGDCRAYEHRPTACRKYLVVSDPDLCDTERHPGGEVGQLISGMAETIASAAMEAFKPPGNIADQVLAALARRAADEDQAAVG